MFARSYAPVAPADFVLGRPAVGRWSKTSIGTIMSLIDNCANQAQIASISSSVSAPRHGGIRPLPLSTELTNRALSSGRNMEPEQQSRAE
jgi:hypothetical protein